VLREKVKMRQRWSIYIYMLWVDVYFPNWKAQSKAMLTELYCSRCPMVGFWQQQGSVVEGRVADGEVHTSRDSLFQRQQ
jgi:hypothetical protein